LSKQVNNAVGTLAMGHYYDEDTVASVIFGAGTNASYIERNSAITKNCSLLTNSGLMVQYLSNFLLYLLDFLFIKKMKWGYK
jgi:hexokinase